MLFGCFQPCFSGSLSREADPASLVAQSAAWLATQTIKCEESVVRSCSISGEAERSDVFSSGICAPLWLLSATVSLMLRFVKLTYISHASQCEPMCRSALHAYWLNLSALQHDRALCGGMMWDVLIITIGTIRIDSAWQILIITIPDRAIPGTHPLFSTLCKGEWVCSPCHGALVGDPHSKGFDGKGMLLGSRVASSSA